MILLLPASLRTALLKILFLFLLRSPRPDFFLPLVSQAGPHVTFFLPLLEGSLSFPVFFFSVSLNVDFVPVGFTAPKSGRRKQV